MRYRTIDPGVWRHPAFLRNPRTARDVFLYLFSAAADDEGRFKWDTYAVLEGAFPRSYPETPEDVEAALDVLLAEGLVVRYGEAGQYGFLTGWYEHQYVRRDRRQPSSLPEPPNVPIKSWADADAIRTAYASELGRPVQYATVHEAADWHTGRQRNGDAASTPGEPSKHQASTAGIPSVNQASTNGCSEVEVEVGSGRGSTTLVPVASDVDAAPADPAPVVPSEPTPTATTRPPKQTPEQIEADIAELTAGFRNGDLEAVEAFLVMAATHRANRTLANTKRRAFLVDLLAIRNLPEMTAEGFAHGIQAAVNADADNANYVKKAALGYATKSQRASPGGTGKQPRLGPAPSGTFDDPDEALKGWYGKHD